MAYHVKFDMLCKLLPLYNPAWLTDFINDDKTWFNFDLNYEELMQLMDMGYLKKSLQAVLHMYSPGLPASEIRIPKETILSTVNYYSNGYYTERTHLDAFRTRINHRLSG